VLKYFVPGVLIYRCALVNLLAGRTAGVGGGPNVQRGAFAALAVLVLGYPCALGMATPACAHPRRRQGRQSRHPDALGDAFQIFPDIDHIVLDKTGTITVGEPVVSEIVGVGEGRPTCWRRQQVQRPSEHPLADAILDHADDRGVEYADPESFDSVTGNGVRATVAGDDVLVGKPGWLEAEGVDLSDAGDEIERLATAPWAHGIRRRPRRRPVGLIGIGDGFKTDAAETVQRIKDAGITPVMITGDNERTAQAVAEEVGIERVMADVLPDEKREEMGVSRRR